MATYNTSFASFCLLSTLLTFFGLPSASLAPQPHPGTKTTSTEFIRSKCNTTDYPNLCIASLLSYAPTINNSPLHLADAALNVSLHSAKSASTMMSRLKSTGSSGSRMSAREAEAVSDCVETLTDSVGYLRHSLKEMEMRGLKGREARERINDVQTWVSTALTDESTCMDGLGGDNNGEQNKAESLKSSVRGRVVRVAQLTSNALALIGGLMPTESGSP